MKRLALIVALLIPVVAFAGRSAGGTYSLPAGNPVTTGTLITTAWANTTLSDIAQGLTDSLDRNGRGSMAAQLRLLDGTISAPGIGYGNETNTGWYRAGSADLRLTLTGVDRERVTSAASAPAFTWTSPQAAAGTQTDFLFNTSATRTGGNLFDLQNNGTTKFKVRVDGIVFLGGTSSGTKAIYAGPATDNETLWLLGSRTAADGGANVIISGQATRTAGTLLLIDNGGTKATIDFNGLLSLVYNPASTIAVSNALAAKNIVKAWANMTVGAAGACTVNDGFNVSSCSWATGQLTVTLASNFASTNYAVNVTAMATGVWGVVHFAANANKAVGSFLVSQVNAGTGTLVNWAVNEEVTVIAVGAQ